MPDKLSPSVILTFEMALPHLKASHQGQSNPFRFSANFADQPAGRDGLGWRWQLAVFFIAVVVIVSRRPDALFNPQFFAEDGTVWFANAYTMGWLQSLFHSQNGYFQTLPRLAASLALAAPLRYAPLIMNLIGIAFQVLPVSLLLSWRCSNWAPISVRAFMAFAYLALPNTVELDASVEEGQWHLALAACMIVLARAPGKSLAWKLFDITVILLSGFTGPFCILLLPVALIFWWFRREPFRLVLAGAIAIPAVIQLSAILQSAEATRPRVGLGATPKLFIELLAGQVYLGAILGRNTLHAYSNPFMLAIVALLATAILIYCALNASLELRLFILFALMVFTVSLHSPMVSLTVPQWQILREAGAIRYWFFPMLAFVWALIWCAREGNIGVVRFGAGAGLMFMLVGVTRDWSYPAYTDFNFAAHAKQFEAAAPGTSISLPIYPDGWALRLTKKAPLCKSLPIGFIDQPAINARLIGPTVVTGWAVGYAPVQQIKILVDHVPVQVAKLTLVRPDIDRLYPASPDKQKGWTTLIDTSRLSPGSHQITARAHESDGCEADFFVLPVQSAK